MEVVCLAVHNYLKTEVAVKVLPPLHANNAEFVSRFMREAEILAKLKHPNIVEVRDFGVQNNRYCLVLEFVNGGDIGELLAAHDKRLPPAKSIMSFKKCCLGWNTPIIKRS